MAVCWKKDLRIKNARLRQSGAAPCNTPVLLLVLVIAGALPLSALSPAEAAGAGAVFRSRCTGCHTYGQGVKVGPDLTRISHTRSVDRLRLRC